MTPVRTQGDRFSCGNCGARFETKGAKHRHKMTCAAPPPPVHDAQDDDPQDWYGRVYITPEIKALADAEWAAMDEFGRLPKGWTYTRITGGDQ